MSVLALRYALVALALVFVFSSVWASAKRPSRDRQHPHRYRQPIAVAIIGWLLVSAGFFIGLTSFTVRGASELWPMRITGVVAVLVGAFFLMMHRNRYVELRRDGVRFRTAFGRVREIAVADAVEVRMLLGTRHPTIQVRSRQGVRLRVDARRYPIGEVFTVAR